MNITETLRDKELRMSLLTDSIPPFLFNFILMDSLTYFCVELKPEPMQQFHSLYKLFF